MKYLYKLLKMAGMAQKLVTVLWWEIGGWDEDGKMVKK